MMGEDEITYKDIEEYDSLFSLAPSFLLERFARKNTNLVLKFHSSIQSHLDKLDETHKKKLDIILDTDVDRLQALLHEAYLKTNKKQYKILANPKYKYFIEFNLNEIRKMVD